MSISNIFKISFIISSLMLLSAFYLEYFHGALPCDLCITQRWFHGAIIGYSFIIILIINKTLISNKLLVLVGAILWLSSSLAGLYHFGIEMNFWIGPDGCSSNVDFSKHIKLLICSCVNAFKFSCLINLANFKHNLF